MKLVDMYASEAYDRKVVGVQVSPPAQFTFKFLCFVVSLIYCARRAPLEASASNGAGMV